MYSDPKHIRNKRVNLSLNDVEFRLAEAAAEFNGMQPSVLLRELVLEGLQRLVHVGNSAGNATEMRATQ